METTTLCRCCLLRPPDKDLKTPYVRLDVGIPEVYQDMLEKCFEIHVIMGSDDECGICNVCVGRLRDANDFKLQVQRSQVELQARLAVLLVKDEEPVLNSSRAEVVSEKGNDGTSSAMLDDEPDGPEVKPETAEEGTNEVSCLEVISEPSNDGSSGVMLDDEPEVKSETAEGGVSEVSRLEVIVESENDGASDDMFDDESEVKSETAEGGTSEVSRPEVMSEPGNDGASGNMLDKEPEMESETAEGGSSEVSRPEVMSDLSEPGDDGASGDMLDGEPPDESEASDDAASVGDTPQSACGEYHPRGARWDHTYARIHQTPENEYPVAEPARAVSARARQQLAMACSVRLERLVFSESSDDESKHASDPEHGDETRNKKHTDVKQPYSCKICHKIFKHKTNLYVHAEVHKKEQHFSCDICNERFITENELKLHMRVHSVQPYSCEVCNETFVFKSYLANHMATHSEGRALKGTLRVHLKDRAQGRQIHRQENLHAPEIIISRSNLENCIINQEKAYSCNICNKAFARKGYLRNHIVIHSENKAYACELCGRRFRYNSTLHKHMKIHTKEKRFFCDICKKGFYYKYLLKTHMLTHGPEYLHNPEIYQSECVDDKCKKQFEPKICQKQFALKGTFNVNLKSNTEEITTSRRTSHVGNKPFSCDICKKGFAYKCTLKRHMPKHGPEYLHPPEIYQSELVDDVCKNQFEPKENLFYLRENSVHRKEAHSCDICNKQFTHKSHLIKHLHLHTTGKPYSCEVCLKRFALKGTLNVHLKSHTQIRNKPFSCDICNKEFANKTYLKKHMAMHSEDKPYACKICDKRFKRFPGLYAHIKCHTKEKRFYCNICNKGFAYKYILRRHMPKHRQELQSPETNQNQNEICKIQQDSPLDTRVSHSCDVCKKEFAYKSRLKRHLRVHTGEKPHSCEVSHKQFSVKVRLNNRAPEITMLRSNLENCIINQENAYSCHICNKAFARKLYLRNHLAIHSEEKAYVCEVCGRRFRYKPNLYRHMKIHTTEKRFFCDICKKGFHYKYLLKRHMPTHGPEYLHTPKIYQSEFVDDMCKKQFQPKICSKQIALKSTLNADFKSHREEITSSRTKSHKVNKTFSCDICNKVFAFKSYLRSHKAIHSEDKAYACEICDKRFKQREALYPHLKIHTNEKRFYCDICKKGFAYQYLLKRHMSKHRPKYLHPPETYQSELVDDICKKQLEPKVCLKQFALKGTFNVNLKSDTGEITSRRKSHLGNKPFSCDICKKCFADKCTLKRHMPKHGPEYLHPPEIYQSELVDDVYTNQLEPKVCLKQFALKGTFNVNLKSDTKEITSRRKSHLGNKPFSCDICKKCFADKCTLKRHMPKHGPEYHRPEIHQSEVVDDVCKNQLEPKVCLKQFALKDTFNVNLKSDMEEITTSRKTSHIVNKPFSCDICKKGFAYKCTLKRHMPKHGPEYHRPEIYQSELVDDVCKNQLEPKVCLKQFALKDTFNVNLKSDMEEITTSRRTSHIVNKPFSCDICKKGFAYKCTLKRHMPKHGPEYLQPPEIYQRKLVDDVCKNLFERKENLFLLRDTHSCNICKQEFTCKSLLMKHLYEHIRVKPYSCEVCLKKFSVKASLTKHLKTHTGNIKNKPFSCDICKKVFALKSYLEIHMAIHSEKKAYACEECGKRFRHLSNVYRHMKCHTKEKRFYCDICQKGFAYKYTLKLHMPKHEQEYLHPLDTYQSELIDDVCQKPFVPKENSIHIKDAHSCDICNKQFTHKSHLIKHLYIHTTGKPYSCEVCLKRFALKGTLNVHLKSHTQIRNKPFSCDICNKEFANKPYLKSHMGVHSEDKPYACKICDKRFKRFPGLNAHMKSHTKEKRFYCNICNKGFAYNYILGRHMPKHRPELQSSETKQNQNEICKIQQDFALDTRVPTRYTHSCDVCKKEFAYKSLLKRHLRVHTGEKPYSCELCHKQFSEKGSLNNHLNMHTKYPFFCDICKKGFKNRFMLISHMSDHTGVKDYTCVICGNEFVDRKSLDLHIARVHTLIKILPYCCEKCGKQFKSEQIFTTHMNGHLGLKPHLCKLCNKRFTWPASLKKHIKLHIEAKPYGCEICHKRFSRKLILRAHMMIHSGLKPHSCKICNRPFRAKNALDVHIRRIHTGERPFACDICNKAFAEHKDLKFHRSTHTAEKPFACGICSRKFSLRRRVKAHLYAVHKEKDSKFVVQSSA